VSPRPPAWAARDGAAGAHDSRRLRRARRPGLRRRPEPGARTRRL